MAKSSAQILPLFPSEEITNVINPGNNYEETGTRTNVIFSELIHAQVLDSLKTLNLPTSSESVLAGNELLLPFYEQTSLREGVEDMDDGFRKLIDRLDQDIRDHKKEVNSRDERLQSEMQEREKRMHEDAKEREERILAAINSTSERMNQQLTNVQNELTSIKSDVSNNVKHVQSLVTTNMWGVIATVIAIVALSITVIIAIT